MGVVPEHAPLVASTLDPEVVHLAIEEPPQVLLDAAGSPPCTHAAAMLPDGHAMMLLLASSAMHASTLPLTIVSPVVAHAPELPEFV